MDSKTHWERVYRDKEPSEVSWFQDHPTRSLALIQAAVRVDQAHIIDVGGGASVLVDCLLDLGCPDITVVDISGAALARSRDRLGARSDRIHWVEADITEARLAGHAYDLWHDRAVFHFLTTPELRRAYMNVLSASLKPGGAVVIATFADDGPLKCSGLDVARYSAQSLASELGDSFELVESEREVHRTPWDSEQAFVICLFRKVS